MLIGKTFAAGLLVCFLSATTAACGAPAPLPNGGSMSENSRLNYQSARKAIEHDKYRVALVAANKSLQYDPLNPLALYLRGRIFEQLDEPDKATKDFERAQTVCPSCAEAYDYFWASDAYFRQDKKARGMATIEAGLKRYPSQGMGSCMLFSRRGMEESIAGQEEAAMKDFGLAIKQSGAYQTPRLQRARLYIGRNRADLAVGDYTAVINKCKELKLEDSDLSEALRGRAKCYGLLGKTTLQAADLKQLKEMGNSFATDLLK